MDDRRFDALVRMVGQGASRRSILKVLLGIGGAIAGGAVADEGTDARTLRTRPSLTTSPPSPTTTPAPTTTTAPCPVGQQRCPNSTLCCPAGTCARSGNQAICCTGTVCGLDCCASPYACCDGECCASGQTCLTQVFPEGPNVQEEVCCPAQLACDNQCCDGGCYDERLGPVWDGDFLFNGHPVVVARLECCPAGGTICEGADGTLCCRGETPQCCHRDGVAVCIAAEACCTDESCSLGECDVCDTTDPVNSQCVDNDEICEGTYGPCSQCSDGVCQDVESLCGLEGCLTCVNGRCIENDEECPDACAICFNGACVFDCRAGQGCCGDCGVCDLQTGDCMAPTEDPCGACQICTAETATPGFNCRNRGTGQHPGCDTCQYCLNGNCVDVEDETDTFGDCGLCQYCVNGACTNVAEASDPLGDCPPVNEVDGVCCPSPADASVLICQPGPTCGCDSDAECPGGLVCDLQSNICVTTTTTSTTTTTTTTSTTSTTTTTMPPTCPGGCPEGCECVQVAAGPVCLYTQGAVGPCQENACPGDQICYAGGCYTTCEPATGTTTTTPAPSPCPGGCPEGCQCVQIDAGLVCIDMQAAVGPCVDDRCSDDEVCYAGGCHGICGPPATGTTTPAPSPCPGGCPDDCECVQVAAGPVCLYTQGAVGPCQDNACPGDQVCHAGGCYTTCEPATTAMSLAINTAMASSAAPAPAR